MLGKFQKNVCHYIESINCKLKDDFGKMKILIKLLQFRTINIPPTVSVISYFSICNLILKEVQWSIATRILQQILLIFKNNFQLV